MSVSGLQETSLRPGRFDYKRLAWAFAISLAVHLLFYGGYRFSRNVLPGWLERAKMFTALAEALRPKPPVVPPAQPSASPLVFVEVNPAVATPEPPKDAKYYSSQNSKAADIESKLNTDTPKITGNQEHVVKTQDAPRPFDKLQPSAPPAKETETAEVAKPKPKPAPVIGDLAMAKPDTTLHPDIALQQPENDGTAQQTRPRTIREALARQHSELIPGQKIKQDGGVHRHLDIASLDAKATPFGDYDRAFIEAVQQHWYDLLDNMNFSYDRHGRVVLQFHLNYDGSITDMKILDDTVDGSQDGVLGFLCQRAVSEPSPYEKWPREMRLQVDKDYREIEFAFFYE